MENCLVRLDTFSPSRPEWELEMEMEEEMEVEVMEMDEGLKKRELFRVCSEHFGHLNKSIKCDKCGKKFKHKKSLKRHNNKIPFCDQSQFINSIKYNINVIDLAKNIKSSDIKKNNEEKVQTGRKCEICQHNFLSSDKLQIHREEFHSTFQCCLCEKFLGNRHKLKSHHRTHTKEKPFECKLCEKKFSECGSLRKHVLTHNIKTFQCNNCDKMFARKDYLVKHIKSNVCFLNK